MENRRAEWIAQLNEEELKIWVLHTVSRKNLISHNFPHAEKIEILAKMFSDLLKILLRNENKIFWKINSRWATFMLLTL